MTRRAQLVCAGAGVVAVALAVGCGRSGAEAARSRGAAAGEQTRAPGNLGPLGAAASPTTSDTVIELDGDEYHPGGLVLRQVDADGPLGRAGLRTGDVVVVAGEDPLPNTPDPTLALIEAVEGSISVGAELRIGWLRGGELVHATVPVDVPPLENGLPEAVERFELGARLALERLAALQRPDGSFAVLEDSAPARLAAVAVAGLAFLSSGSDLRRGPFEDRVGWCYEVVGDAVAGRDAAGAAANAAASSVAWGDAFALMFLAELAASSPSRKLQRLIARLGDRLVSRQADDGGFASADLAIDERDLLTNQALFALGMARRAGAPIDDSVVAKACGYLKETANDGHLGFANRPGFDRRNEAGRCAGAAAALVAWNCRREDPYLGRLRDLVERRGREIAFAPLGAPLHTLHAAIASRQEGGADWQRFYADLRHVLVAVQRRDGACVWLARPSGERSGADRSDARPLPFAGEAFDTACLALILGLQRDPLPVLLGRHVPDDLPTRDSDGAVVEGGADVADAADGPRAWSSAALPPGVDAGDATTIRLSGDPEDLQKQLEELGLPQDQIDDLKRQIEEQRQANKKQ